MIQRSRFSFQKEKPIAEGKLKPDAPKQQLYNLADDPRQSQNVIRQHPEIAGKLRARIKQLRE